MTVRTLFIGMDGATFTVLDDLTRSADGAEPVMPFLARIFKDGSRSKLRSTPNPLTPPAWVSLMTGRGPGHHGVFDFIRAEERGDEVYFTLYDARDCRVETIWSIASRQGKRVAALNFPFTAPPPQDLNGFIVPGFVPWRHLRRNSYPDDLYERLKTIPDFNPQELAWDFEQEKQSGTELSDKDREEWVSYHLPRERQWFKVAEHLMREEAPDLMAVLFDGVDKLQHQAWPYVDPRLQGDNLGGFHQRMRELSLGYFRQLDGFIEQLVTAAGPDVQVFFASDHGFTASTEVVRINAYLAEKGYVHFKDLPEGDAGKRRDNSYFAFLDWNKTVAYCRTPSCNGITIRVARNPGETGVAPEDAIGPIAVEHVAERALALHLLDFGTALTAAGEAAEPHRLCAYLFDLASAYTTFYENCPVLKAPDEETKASRLALCGLTLRTLEKGLGLLGVTTPERM